jgi:selenocysteine lyase/cysteine desulfurase
MIQRSTETREQRLALFRKLRSDAVGLDTEYTLVNGERSRRIYLDSTASTLRLGVVQQVLDRFQPHYANTHSVLHFSAKLSTQEYRWAHDMVLDFVGADPELYTAFFLGSGTTAGMNRVARTLREKRPERDVVVSTIMEHHSNDLPHRKHYREVVHVPARMAVHALGCVDLEGIEEALREYGERVNYVAITGVSNVTGIINPVHEIAELAHRYGTLIVVDGAQLVAHLPVQVSGQGDRDLDVLVFSGHKIYAPGSPGVVVTRMDLFADLEPQEVGGGMVDRVYVNRYTVSQEFPDREEAGTPNITGAIGLAASLYALSKVGMDLVAEEECQLIEYALQRMEEIEDVVVYGETDCRVCQRAGAIAFNVRDLDHGLVAAALNDYFNIATRNECFCAHPYVREMITYSLTENTEYISEEDLDDYAELRRGMVRASFGIYSTREDVDRLTAALKHIAENKSFYESQYDRLDNGDYKHKSFDFDHSQVFSVRKVVDEVMGG